LRPALAYGRFAREVDRAALALFDGEAQALRDAADARLWGDDDAEDRLADARFQINTLHDRGRLDEATALRLYRELLAIGSVAFPVYAPAEVCSIHRAAS
jgi:hypothetical protein